MDNLFHVLLATVKAKITPIWTRLKYWTSWSFIRSRILTRIRELLSRLFNVKPRHKKDYFPIFGYLVSKKLAFSIVIGLGICCLYYLIVLNPPSVFTEGMTDGVKVYSYNSLPLRFTSGEVRIKARSGYVAYEGMVGKGYAAGYGTLYNEEGTAVYEGSFERSKYNGSGTLYYPSGQAQYIGNFQNNLFQGEGALYRENGSKQYEGSFEKGLQEGSGILYDSAQNPVFTGEFHLGELVYQQMLGKDASEIASLYTGERMIYMMNTQNVVLMEDIDAFYTGDTAQNSIEDTLQAEQIYVCRDSFIYGTKELTTIREVSKALGKPAFEGNSYLTFPEAVGISYLEEKGIDTGITAKLSAQETFEEVREVTGYDQSAMIYLYGYEKDGMTYTFFAKDRNSGFFMYLLEK